jgi:glycosyltransferase involved in cell wall biosynthesis
MNNLSHDAPLDLQGTGVRGGRRILLAETDLYQKIGGGQSVYRRLIELNPRDTFYYFRRREASTAPRPANTVAIPYAISYRSAAHELPDQIGHFLGTYLECRNLAASVVRHLGKLDFDVVDAPDYRQVALFIRTALEIEGCRVEAVALALHGTLSLAWGHGWPTGQDEGPPLAELHMREQLQVRAADTRYGLSDDYADYWRRQAHTDVNMIDPLLLITRFEPFLAPPSADPPDLIYVGRREKWKGPDIFLDVAWWIDRSTYRRLRLIGPDGPNRIGNGSHGILAAIARHRALPAELVGGLSQAELYRAFASRNLLLLPSRYDTFNLTALEAICSGCPTLVSNRAGIARWLREKLPDLASLIVDIDCSRSAAGQAEAILGGYDEHRAQLVDALQRHDLGADPLTLQSMYHPGSRQDLKARQTVVDLAKTLSLLVRKSEASKLGMVARSGLSIALSTAHRLAPHLPPRSRNRTHRIAEVARAILRRRLVLAWDSKRRLEETLRRTTGFSPRTFVQMHAARRLQSECEDIPRSEDQPQQDLTAAIQSLATSMPYRLVDRVRLFRQLIGLERKAGRQLVAVSYALRVMRWLGKDVYGDLPFVIATLENNSFPREAAVAAAMFGGKDDSQAVCLELMQDAFLRNKSTDSTPLTVLDDRRKDSKPRVSAIVSLYNAADKLPTLLATLQRQSLAQRGELEVVLVDSASPTSERHVFESFVAAHDLPIVYARSAERETIQAAWNRGIRLARAPYLTFLGADEGVHPDGLRQLADALDNDPAVDWAMADSLVTNVDRDGVFDADVMPYDRRGFRQDLTYLETCYLSWVGGLYRRSIHDRFGWYDESFRAAGDTEFKNRVMPHIRSVHVPRLLGVFNNYPEERTTQTPRAEIEDLRAWYLWRTPAGMQYAFGQRPAEDAEFLFRDALNYRKSYARHPSTDFDLASSLADHLAGRSDGPAWAAQAQQAMADAISLLRGIDLVPDTIGSGPGGANKVFWVYRQLRVVQRMGRRHKRLFALPRTPHYEIFNDNRYEQHWYSWSDS